MGSIDHGRVRIAQQLADAKAVWKEWVESLSNPLKTLACIDNKFKLPHVRFYHAAALAMFDNPEHPGEDFIRNLRQRQEQLARYPMASTSTTAQLSEQAELSVITELIVTLEERI